MTEDVLSGEEAIIQSFLAPLAAGYPGAFGLRDDCAAITPTPGHDLVVKTDPVAAGVHFLPDDAPEDVAWKALAVNVSDLAAKGAVPRVYLMALSFPEAPARQWMRRFADGLAAAQAAFGMCLVGGDTDRRPGPLTVSITVLGEVPAGRMVRRATARLGDRIYVSGTLGASATGLALVRDPALAAAWGLTPAEADEAIRRYRRPEPRLALSPAVLAHARAAMDLSDGLAKDLDRMARASGVGAEARLADLPVAAAACKAVAADHARWQSVVAAGDDYEILAAVDPAGSAAFEAAAAAAGVAVTCAGRFTGEPGVRLLDADGRPLVPASTGWEHFA